MNVILIYRECKETKRGSWASSIRIPKKYWVDSSNFLSEYVPRRCEAKEFPAEKMDLILEQEKERYPGWDFKAVLLP